MKFTIRSTRTARREFDEIFDYIKSRSRPGADAWANAFEEALFRLEQNADGCPLAEESAYFEFEVHEAIFKTRRGMRYRILFTIRGNTVTILHIRGPGQDFVDPTDFRDPD